MENINRVKPYIYLPVYHNTEDQRIIKWAEKNMTTHNLAVKAYSKGELNMKPVCSDHKKGNGKIRGWITDGLVASGLVIIFWVMCVAIYAFGG